MNLELGSKILYTSSASLHIYCKLFTASFAVYKLVVVVLFLAVVVLVTLSKFKT